MSSFVCTQLNVFKYTCLILIVVEMLLVNGFIEWNANISESIPGLFCIVFLLLLVSFCVW